MRLTNSPFTADVISTRDAKGERDLHLSDKTIPYGKENGLFNKFLAVHLLDDIWFSLKTHGWGCLPTSGLAVE